MKKMYKILCFALCLVLSVSMLIGCKNEKPLVSFNVGEDAGAIDPIEANVGDIIQEDDIEEPQMVGYDFLGWYVADTKVVFPYTVSKSVTFVAKWEAISYSITYHLDGGTGAEDRTYNIEDLPLTLPTASSVLKENYSFNGWYSNAELTGSRVTNITISNIGDKNLYARWNPTQYVINYELNGGEWEDGVEILDAYNVESEDIKLLSPVHEQKFAFGGWFDNDDYDGDAIWEIEEGSTGDRQFFAKWDAVDYKIKYNLNGGSFEGFYPQGGKSDVSLALVNLADRDGADFGGWYDNENLIGSAVTIIPQGNTNDIELWAKWGTISYQISLHFGEDEIEVIDYEYGDEIELEEPEYRQSHWFMGWFDNEDFEGDPVTQVAAGSFGNKAFWAKWGVRVNTKWRMEAEFIDLNDKQGSGWSNTQSNYGMVGGGGPVNSPTVSNGYYLAYFTKPGTEFSFEFYSDKDFLGDLSFGLVSEFVHSYSMFNGGWPMRSENVELWINGVKIEYEEFAISGKLGGTEEFKNYKIVTEQSAKIQFKKGFNVVTWVLMANGLYPDRWGQEGQAAGPNIDYMEIQTDAYVRFNQYIKDNEELLYMKGL